MIAKRETDVQLLATNDAEERYVGVGAGTLTGAGTGALTGAAGTGTGARTGAGALTGAGTGAVGEIYVYSLQAIKFPPSPA